MTPRDNLMSRAGWLALLHALFAWAQFAAAEAPPLTAAAFPRQGRVVVVGSQKGVQVLSWPALQPVRTVALKLSHIHDLVFSPAEDLLAVVGGTPGEEGVVEMLRWPAGTPVARHRLGDEVLHALAWRPDGKEWAVASADGTCHVFAQGAKHPRTTFTGHSRSVLAIIYMPDGKTILSAGIDQTLRLWEAETGKALRTMENHVGAVQALALRPAQGREKATLVASGSLDRTVRLWQPTLGRLVRFVRLPSPVLAVCWSNEGSHLLAACQDGHLRTVDPDTLEITRDQAAVSGWAYTLAVAPGSGNEVLVGGPGGVAKRLAIGQPR